MYLKITVKKGSEMFQKIKSDDDIFTSLSFSNDAITFMGLTSALERAKNSEHKLFSNEKDCVIFSAGPQYPIVVWTDDNFQEYEKLYDFIQDNFKDNKSLKIMSKKNFYDYLIENKKMPHQPDLQTAEAYSCQNLNAVSYDGRASQIKPEEVGIVAQMLVDFDVESGELPKKEPDAQDYKKAHEFISNPSHLVWRNSNNDIATIAYTKESEKIQRICSVFTPKIFRGKGYARMLVHHLTSQILKNGNVAALYVDEDNSSAIKTYLAVGYKLNGALLSFEMPKKQKTQQKEYGIPTGMPAIHSVYEKQKTNGINSGFFLDKAKNMR